MNDIVQKATAVYLRLIENDTELIRLRKSIESGKASYEAAQKYSERSGQLAKKAISQVSNGDLTITQKILNPILEANYQDVMNITSQAQNVIYEAANVNLKPATVSYDNTYAKDISAKLENYDDVDDALNAIENTFISASQNYVDEIGRRSAKFMDESGINVLVSREYDDVGVHTTDKGGGDVCHWCLERCGTDVPYDEAYEMGMFERHPGCGCIITYTTKRGVVIQGKGDWETNNWHTTHEEIGKEKRIKFNLYHKKTGEMTPDEFLNYQRELDSIKHLEKKQIILSKSEYAIIMTELNTNLSSEERKHAIIFKAIGDYRYKIINKGFNDYVVIRKEKL